MADEDGGGMKLERERRLCGSTRLEKEGAENGLERRVECDLGEVEGKEGLLWWERSAEFARPGGARERREGERRRD